MGLSPNRKVCFACTAQQYSMYNIFYLTHNPCRMTPPSRTVLLATVNGRVGKSSLLFFQNQVLIFKLGIFSNLRDDFPSPRYSHPGTLAAIILIMLSLTHTLTHTYTFSPPIGTEFSTIMNATSIRSLLISQLNADGGGNELPSIDNAIDLPKYVFSLPFCSVLKMQIMLLNGSAAYSWAGMGRGKNEINLAGFFQHRCRSSNSMQLQRLI